MRTALALCLLASAPASAASFPQEVRRFYSTADGLPSNDVVDVAASGGRLYVKTSSGVAVFAEGRFAPSNAAIQWPRKPVQRTTDTKGRVWSTLPGAIECRDGASVTRYSGAEGLPYDDFTTLAPGENGVIWIGTHKGAIRYDGAAWEYRQGLRWLPDDDVRAIAVEPGGNAWFATGKGLGLIERRSITFDEKASLFESEIDKRHRRTPFGYVFLVKLKRPGDLSQWEQEDSDNDGLWTAMYGAGECFDYAARHSEASRTRAKAAFEALRFLRVVTEGGPHPAPKGFVARSILPASGPDPNKAHSPERDQQKLRTDPLWKVMSPRWPLSADGKWYWKSDTSSDELDGHFFFYGIYYDLVASTEAEKLRVGEHVAAIVDHLIGHNFQFVDYDGKTARWGFFNPESLNHDPQWSTARGLNSLEILTYLKVAEHITGAARATRLVDQHAYDTNVLIPKTNAGPGSGNQSDDEMAFMCFYNILRYETDPVRRRKYAVAFHNYWLMERPELNPLFNFLYAAVSSGKPAESPVRARNLAPGEGWLEESLDTLRRYPLDRVSWRLLNGHRKDVVSLPGYVRARSGRRYGSRNNGQVLPVDERFVDRWNHDPWQLDQGGNGTELADGASFLLPYYMGRYYGYVR